MAEADLTKPDQHQAFKTGYRLALKKGRLSQMPSYIRRSTELRIYFEQGWQQAHNELKSGHSFNKTHYIRHRVTWIVMTALAGLATAFLISKHAGSTNSFTQIWKPQYTQQTATQTAPTQTSTPASFEWQGAAAGELSLLSEAERASLTTDKTQLGIANLEQIAVAPLVESSVIANTQLAHQLDPAQTFEINSEIPKYIRLLNFDIKLAYTTNQTFTIRWLWQRQLIQSRTYQAQQRKIQSQLSLFSAGQGQWDVEILDPTGQVIYRYPFSYGQQE